VAADLVQNKPELQSVHETLAFKQKELQSVGAKLKTCEALVNAKVSELVDTDAFLRELAAESTDGASTEQILETLCVTLQDFFYPDAFESSMTRS
jgi:hypothetical protein